MWELRGSAAANAVAAALLAASLLKLLPPQQGAVVVFGQRPVSLALVFALTPLLLAVSGHAVARAAQWASAVPSAQVSSAREQCHEVSSYAPLAALPAGRVLAFIDSGAFILAQTRHSVLAAPYHRNNEGNLAAVDMLLASPADASAAMERFRIAYVVICPGAPEFKLYQRAGGGLAVQLVQGKVPAWLQPVAPGDGSLRAWRVVPSR
jgi:hypothetical protein